MNPAEELSVIGDLKDTFTVLGHKFAVQTLDSDAEIMVTSGSAPFDKETKEHVYRLEKLVRAIITIDGVPFSVTEEEKAKGMNEVQKARKLLYKWHPPVVKRVYDEFLKLEQKRDEAVAALEKNAPTPTTSTGAGK